MHIASIISTSLNSTFGLAILGASGKYAKISPLAGDMAYLFLLIIFLINPEFLCTLLYYHYVKKSYISKMADFFIYKTSCYC